MNDEYPHAKEKHLIHIKGLEATLAERNRQIAKLKTENEQGATSQGVQQKMDSAYRKGWEDCANRLTHATHLAAAELGRVRQEALTIYFDEAKHKGPPPPLN